MAYHKFKDPEGSEFGSFEVFELGADESPNPGFYWWPCFPGCMPESDPHGPFPTEQDAIEDAQYV